MEEFNEIYLKNEFIKIKNPLEKVKSLKNYKGVLYAGYDWDRQLKNFIQFNNILQRLNIQPTFIYSCKWSSKTASYVEKTLYDNDPDSKVNHHAFVLLTSHPYLVWQRTDVNQPGLSYNWIYIKDNKMKLTDFFNMNDNDIINMLNN